MLLNINTIIGRFKKIHGNKYDYSKVVYKSIHTKVCIICPEHGEFWQVPSNHIKGQGCPLCAKERRKEKETTEGQKKFIEESIKIFKDKFDYSKVKYISIKKKVILICPKHGEIEVIPYEHLHSQYGCKNVLLKLLGK